MNPEQYQELVDLFLGYVRSGRKNSRKENQIIGLMVELLPGKIVRQERLDMARETLPKILTLVREFSDEKTRHASVYMILRMIERESQSSEKALREEEKMLERELDVIVDARKAIEKQIKKLKYYRSKHDEIWTYLPSFRLVAHGRVISEPYDRREFLQRVTATGEQLLTQLNGDERVVRGRLTEMAEQFIGRGSWTANTRTAIWFLVENLIKTKHTKQWASEKIARILHSARIIKGRNAPESYYLAPRGPISSASQREEATIRRLTEEVRKVYEREKRGYSKRSLEKYKKRFGVYPSGLK